MMRTTLVKRKANNTSLPFPFPSRALSLKASTLLPLPLHTTTTTTIDTQPYLTESFHTNTNPPFHQPRSSNPASHQLARFCFCGFCYLKQLELYSLRTEPT